jgi:membrane-bound serine protease (ClpP class)
VRRTLVLACGLLAWLSLAASAQEATAPSEPAAEATPAGAPGAPAESKPEPHLRSGPVLVAKVEGAIDPASADFLVGAINQAGEARAALLLIELDTPGGYLTSTQAIVRAMLRSDVPIAVFVPRGAWAASAGTFITLAGHIAAMAPGSSIGAAHPVNPAGGNERKAADPESEELPPPADLELEKAENFTASFIASIAKERGRNVEWAAKAVRESVAISADEAVELNVIDLVADGREALLDALDGRVVDLGDTSVRLDLKHAEVRELEMGFLSKLLHAIADPQWAFLILVAGAALVWLELNTPGIGVPGVLGTACLIVGAVALQMVPFSWLGLGLFIGGFALVAAELFVGAYGLLLGAGVVCLLLGGSMIFDRPDVSDLDVPFWSIVMPVVASFAAFGALAALAIGRVIRAPSRIGEGELLGMRGVASTPLAPSGTVSLRGELWSADAEGEVAQGDAVEVTGVEGMRLRVRRATKRS